MLYRKLEINGVVYPIAVGQSGKGAPTEDTPGRCGITYLDIDTGILYGCISDEGGKCRWTKCGGSSNSDPGENSAVLTNSVVLKDQATGTRYKLFVSDGKLSMEESADGVYMDSVALKDQTTGATYEIYVSDGKLTMAEGEV